MESIPPNIFDVKPEFELFDIFLQFDI
jgi:hypothetical protein